MAMTNELNRKKPAPKKKKKGGANVIRIIVLIGSVVALCFAVKMLWEYMFGTKEQDELKDSLASVVNQYDRDASSEPDFFGTSPKQILEKYNALLEINADTKGYIKIPGITDKDGSTVIDYPVLQHPTDNFYYLDKDFNRQPSQTGWIYADVKVPMTEQGTADNVTLYGHNMASGKFFHRLHDYKGGWGASGSTFNPSAGIEVLKEVNLIQFDTLYVESDWVIYACFLTGIKESQDNGNLFEYHKVRNFDSQETFDDFYSNVMKRSLYLNDEIDCDINDDYLTLSTCSSEFSDSRFVVCARKLRYGETAEQYQSSYYINPDPWLPYVLYEVYPSLGTPNH